MRFELRSVSAVTWQWHEVTRVPCRLFTFCLVRFHLYRFPLATAGARRNASVSSSMDRAKEQDHFSH